MHLLKKIRKNSNGVLPARAHVISGFMILSLAAILALGTHASAQNVRVGQSGGGMQVVGDQGNTQVSQPQGQTGQVQEQPQELGDIQEDEMIAFDPATIPDSVPIPEADWVFEVPINYRQLPAEVQKIGIHCYTMYTRINPANGQASYRGVGQAKLRLDVQNGSVQQTVLVGVNATSPNVQDYEPWRADKYVCKGYLITADNRWHVPTTDVVAETWRRADPSQPFKYETEARPIPPAARVAQP